MKSTSSKGKRDCTKSVLHNIVKPIYEESSLGHLFSTLFFTSMQKQHFIHGSHLPKKVERR